MVSIGIVIRKHSLRYFWKEASRHAFRESIARCIVCRQVRQKDNTSLSAPGLTQARSPSRENEMLQTVHDESAVPRASSLYCVWIPSRLESGPPLVALWIDDQMRAFELHSRSFPRTSRTVGRTSPMIGMHAKKWGLRQTALWLVAVVCAWLLCSASALAQDNVPTEGPGAPQSQPPTPDDDPLTTMFHHVEWDRLWLSGQANFISQYHPTFTSPYEGKNSLSPQAQDASSRVLTLFTGWRATSTTEFLCDVQETGGHGLGEALGVAGFFNLDVVRNPTLSKAPYIARLMWHQIIPLGHRKVAADRNPFNLFRELPEHRMELRVGKFSMADFFDVNTFGSDTNLQFMNWTVDNNGAYDYAADTRGFTFAALLEYHALHMVVRFAEGLMPKVANGINLDADMSRARAENIEVELDGRVVGENPGIVRFLSYVNHANMGIYGQAVDNFLTGTTPTPEITNHPLWTTVKYGFGITLNSPLTIG
jgi:hypothetical protein